MHSLKVLVVSNHYPPHYIGGYELGCFDVVRELTARGHGVTVLTSSWGVGRRSSEGRVHRWLEVDLTKMPDLAHLVRLVRIERTNRRAFARAVDEFEPEVVYFWNMGRLSISIALDAQVRGLRCCYFVSDEWLSNWERDAWFNLSRGAYDSMGRKLGQILVRPALRLLGMLPPGELKPDHVHFASCHLKQATLAAGKHLADGEVIHWGVDVGRFPYQPLIRQPKRILYAGQLVPHKGIQTAIEAMNVIVNTVGRRDIRLTIAGGSVNAAFVTEMHKLTETYGLRNNVEFTGPVPREELASVYHSHDIFVFPSIWDEPFSIALLEALASGLGIVATATGGSREILINGFNALVFEPRDFHGCARQIQHLLDDPQFFQEIRQNGRCTVETKFSLSRMVDAIEASLERIAA